jgi:hypothetical protein
MTEILALHYITLLLLNVMPLMRLNQVDPNIYLIINADLYQKSVIFIQIYAKLLSKYNLILY